MVIVAARCVKLSGHSSGGVMTPRCGGWRMRRSWMSRRWANSASAHAGAAGDGYGFHGDQIECIDRNAETGAGTGEKVAEVTERAMRGSILPPACVAAWRR